MAGSVNLLQQGRSAGTHSQAGSVSLPSQEGVQAHIPRQAVLVPPSYGEVSKSGVSRPQ